MLSVDQIADVIRQLDRMKVMEITFTGGEPTVRKGFYSLLDCIPELEHATVTLITNAYALTQAQMDRIIDSGIHAVRVSIDGSRGAFEKVRLVDGFDRVLENAKYLAAGVPSFKILTTVMTTNYDEIFPLVDQLMEAGFRRQDLILVRAHGRGGRNMLLLSEAQTMNLLDDVDHFKAAIPPLGYELNLNAPYLREDIIPRSGMDVVFYPYLVEGASVAISATGDVTMSRLASTEPIGNVKQDSLEEIWSRRAPFTEFSGEGFSPARLREIYWNFAAVESGAEEIALTSLLDRQIFEGAAVQ
jgi:MoaA/NifB/PqqE/SkfB family radical SAM enzyme